MKCPSNLLSSVLAVLAACASPAAVRGADDPQASKAAVRDAHSTDRPPMIIRNPDGTFTIQKVPPKEHAKDAAKNGLVIPPQVVVPICGPSHCGERLPKAESVRRILRRNPTARSGTKIRKSNNRRSICWSN